MEKHNTVAFSLGGMYFEYDEAKEKTNRRKHGISFRSAARVFFDYDLIETVDEEHSENELRYDVIGDTSAGDERLLEYGRAKLLIGNVRELAYEVDDVVYVVYTERIGRNIDGQSVNVIRMISAYCKIY